MNTMKCVKKFTNDGLAKWYQVYLLLLDNGPMTKKEILDRVWPARHSYYPVVDRGYCSDIFAEMHRQKIIVYNSSTRKWSAKKTASKKH
jgi:hypothetical protein